MKLPLARLGTTIGAVGIILVALTTPVAGQPPAPSGNKTYLPFISVPAPPPTPTPSPTPVACPSTGQSYGQLPIVGPPTNVPAAQNGDLNLQVRGWATAPNNPPLTFVNYNGSHDAKAPQLSGLLGGLPSFTEADEVYEWTNNTRGPLDNQWPVTLLGLGTRPGQTVSTPPSGYAIGQGYEVLVLYATNNQITLTFTGNDSIVYGYSMHVENVCVDPNLQNLYNQLNAAGRSHLPALQSGQPFGTATGSQLLVAIRDSGSFMDPRSQADWWKGF